jgi:parallel beta-helix repeat protein
VDRHKDIRTKENEMSVILQRLSVAACIAATSFGFSASTVHAQSFQSVICDSGNDLQKQIDTAHDGATIFFGDGICEGPYVISGRDVNLRGFSSGGTLSAPDGSACVLSIEFARVNISRLEIDATGADNGICVGIGGTVRIFENTEVKNAGGAGISLGSGASALIHEDTIIEDNGVGVVLFSGAHASIEESQIKNNDGDGIFVEGSASAVLSRNEITGNRFAGVLVDVNSTIYLNEMNTIEDNSIGVRCGISGALVVHDEQDFGDGNPGPDPEPAPNVLADTGCHVTNNAPDSSFPATSTTFPPP